MASAYHPQSNGQTERYNQTLANLMVKYVNDEQDNWDRFIDPMLLAYRSSIHKSTKETPFYLALGKKLKLPIEETFPTGNQVDEDEDQLSKRILAVTKMLDIQFTAQENIKSAQATQKKHYDPAHQPPTYTVGDLVLVKSVRRRTRMGDKLAPR